MSELSDAGILDLWPIYCSLDAAKARAMRGRDPMQSEEVKSRMKLAMKRPRDQWSQVEFLQFALANLSQIVRIGNSRSAFPKGVQRTNQDPDRLLDDISYWLSKVEKSVKVQEACSAQVEHLND